MSPRHSTRRQTTMEYSFWLVFDADGGMRFSRGEPSLTRGERGMACTMTLPLAIFKTPTLRATINLSEPASADFNIDIEAASDALSQALGVDIDMQVHNPGV